MDEDDRVAVREYNRKWRAANPNKVRANAASYRDRNRESLRERKRRAHTERMLSDPEYAHRERLRNKLKRAVQRAKAYGNACGECSGAAILARIEYYGALCWICGADATTIDHVIAISRGGTNWPANLRPACASCNFSKNDRDWRPYVAARKSRLEVTP